MYTTYRGQKSLLAVWNVRNCTKYVFYAFLPYSVYIIEYLESKNALVLFEMFYVFWKCPLSCFCSVESVFSSVWKCACSVKKIFLDLKHVFYLFQNVLCLFWKCPFLCGTCFLLVRQCPLCICCWWCVRQPLTWWAKVDILLVASSSASSLWASGNPSGPTTPLNKGITISD